MNDLSEYICIEASGGSLSDRSWCALEELIGRLNGEQLENLAIRLEILQWACGRKGERTLVGEPPLSAASRCRASLQYLDGTLDHDAFADLVYMLETMEAQV